jgi:vacuolar-type H+-ATPase catalytic subunit A/Vma1
MKDQTGAITPSVVQETIGDRIRKVADRLNEETQIQIKATSRILGAAAQIAQNHDRLIDEVVNMVEEDLDQQENFYTGDRLKQQFKLLTEAKSHFNLKANSWANLAEKLNQSKSAKPASQQTKRSSKKSADPPPVNSAILDRLDKIEAEMQTLRADLAIGLEAIGRLEQRIR